MSSETLETLEILETLESLEPLESPQEAAEIMERELQNETPLYEVLDKTAERLQESLVENAEALQDFLSPLRELKEPLGDMFGEFGEVIGELLESGLELLDRDVEWLKENPELVEGAFKVMLLVLLAEHNPELVIEYIKEYSLSFEDTLNELPDLREATSQS